MPWYKSRKDQRLDFVLHFSSCRYTMTELCRVYGISRKTGYKWVQRYAEQGVAGLEDRSKAPKRCPHATDARCVQRLVELRQRHPRWGPRKLLAILHRTEPSLPWPAASTAGAILKRHGLVQPRRRPCRLGQTTRPDFVATAPNQMWTADFKGHFRVGDGETCYPLTAADQASRFVLECRACRGENGREVRPAFEEMFREYGLPDSILTDSGPPFGSPQSPRRMSRLAVWWIRLGIRPLQIEPGHPEQNGIHERMHRTLKAETARPPAADFEHQQSAFDRFRHEYNELRPHEALGMTTPQEHYRPSSRPYPDVLPEPTYPGYFEPRYVDKKGYIWMRHKRFFVSEVLCQELLGLEEVDEGLWSIYFGNLLLGRYDERERTVDLL